MQSCQPGHDEVHQSNSIDRQSATTTAAAGAFTCQPGREGDIRSPVQLKSAHTHVDIRSAASRIAADRQQSPVEPVKPLASEQSSLFDNSGGKLRTQTHTEMQAREDALSTAECKGTQQVPRPVSSGIITAGLQETYSPQSTRMEHDLTLPVMHIPMETRRSPATGNSDAGCSLRDSEDVERQALLHFSHPKAASLTLSRCNAGVDNGILRETQPR